jgi:hypothetical protein
MGCCSGKAAGADATLASVQIEIAATITPPPLSEPVRKIMLNLSLFVKSRDEVLATAKLKMPKNYMNKYESFKLEEYMRQRVASGAYAASYDDLLAVAEKARLIFEQKLSGIVREAGLEPEDPAMHEGTRLVLDAKKDLFFKHLTIAPPKSRESCEEKATNEYGGDYSLIVDVTRCSIVVETEEQLLAVAECLTTCGEPAERLSSGDPPAVGCFVLIRLKNRFAKPLFNGYQARASPFAGHTRMRLPWLSLLHTSLPAARTHPAAHELPPFGIPMALAWPSCRGAGWAVQHRPPPRRRLVGRM